MGEKIWKEEVIMKNNKVFMALFAVSLLAFTTACGKVDDAMASVAEEDVTVVPEATEIPAKEVDSNVIYVESHGLEFTEDTEATTKGILYVGDDTDTLQVIDVDWAITNITVGEVENGVQTITIEQESHGYIWTDDTGNIFATNLNMPVGRLCDHFTGIMIPVDGLKAEINYKDGVYAISAEETVSWEDGDWKTDWVEAPNGDGEILPSTLKVRTEVTVTEGYAGLALILTPITDANGSVDGEKIMDVWTEDSYLFNINELSGEFKDIVTEDEAVASKETGAEESVATTTAPTATPKPTEQSTGTTSKPADSTPKPTSQPATHTHNYTSNVTVQPTCVNAGEKTFTCTGCGNSYTESIGTTAHNYVETTSVIHHDEQYEAVKREIPGYNVIICGCGEEFTNNDVWNNHCIANIEANGPFIACAGPYDIEQHPPVTTYDYVKVAEAWNETVTTYRCSVCGQQK